MNEEIKKHLKEKVSKLPSQPGVYLMKDQWGNIIYIGKAKNLKNRVSSYFVNTVKALKVEQMVKSVFTFDYVVTNSEWEALNLESNFIKQHKPFYNILLKDGKGHAFIKIDLKQQFPKLEVTRQVKNDGAKYFGPYFSGIRVADVMKIITTTFQLRDCNLSIKEEKPYKRECLNYYLGLCSAPCTNRISKEEYGLEVARVMDFLNGNLDTARDILTKKMMQNAELENFERAIEIRDSLELINRLNQKVITELQKNVDLDVFGYATNGFYSVVSVLVVRAGKTVGVNNFFVLDSSLTDGETLNSFVMQYYQNTTIPSEIVAFTQMDEEVKKWLSAQGGKAVTVTVPQKNIKKKLLDLANQNANEHLEKNLEQTKAHWVKTIGALQELQTDLHLSSLPVRMECYDISNMQGTNIVASMVVFVNGEPARTHYRKFKIQSVVGKNNDFESMREVITRRLNNLSGNDESFKNFPNLIVIDGGKGQLGVAVEVLNQMGVETNIVSLAKKQEEVFVPYQSESIYLNRNHNGLKLLQQIRDEAHRFAITFHRAMRNKNELVSELNNIPGVGEKTRKLLIAQFHGIGNIAKASYEELLAVKGINKTVAKNIVNHFITKQSQTKP